MAKEEVNQRALALAAEMAKNKVDSLSAQLDLIRQQENAVVEMLNAAQSDWDDLEDYYVVPVVESTETSTVEEEIVPGPIEIEPEVE